MMDANAEKLLRQIKEYQESVTAYETARLEIIEKEHRALKLTDEGVQKELKAIGVDVESLLKDTAAEEKELKKMHKKFLALVRPPIHASCRFAPARAGSGRCHGARKQRDDAWKEAVGQAADLPSCAAGKKGGRCLCSVEAASQSLRSAVPLRRVIQAPAHIVLRTCSPT